MPRSTIRAVPEIDFVSRRSDMVEHQIAARGVRSKLVLEAMRKVPREEFLPPSLREFAYEDSPLPIAEGQTISQPYIVAFMADALLLKGGEQVLEIGTGSGYAAAVLAEIAANVYSVERIGQLAEKAAVTLTKLGYDNVHVLHADGTQGWPEHAPYDAIVVAAGGPKIPESLQQQLKVGGRLVIPVGTEVRAQELVRVTRVSQTEFRREDLADVRFVPLLGKEGWEPEAEPPLRRKLQVVRPSEQPLSRIIASAAEPFGSIETADLKPLLNRIGDARVVLIGEASHGTSEFYRMRDKISRALIETKGFNFVAIEADWPDAARIDHYVRHREYRPSEWTAFSRFPIWMWRNNEVRAFVDWLRSYNAAHKPTSRCSLSWAGFVQPVRFDPLCVGISRKCRSRVRQGRARTLRLSDALAVRSSHLRPRGAHWKISHLRSRCRARAQRPAPKTPSLRRSRW